ncbi:SRPBCC domain-containing protein [Virgibacillus oceani]
MESIEHLLEVKVPAEKVYEALTTEKGLSEVWTNDLKVHNQINALNEFRFGDNDESKMRVMELVPGKRVSWKCIESDEPEWVNTIISFDIEEIQGETEITFRHMNWQKITGCYRSCNYNWAIFLNSLKQYCEEGKGQPYQKRRF